MPERIQRKRTRGWKMPPNTVYVGRPSKWGNPYHIGQNYIDKVIENDEVVEHSWDSIDAKTAIAFYEEAITKKYPAVKITVEEIIAELRGKNLACWCPLDKPCHADVLLRLAALPGEAVHKAGEFCLGDHPGCYESIIRRGHCHSCGKPFRVRAAD
jgi:hypothetical protein